MCSEPFIMNPIWWAKKMFSSILALKNAELISNPIWIHLFGTERSGTSWRYCTWKPGQIVSSPKPFWKKACSFSGRPSKVGKICQIIRFAIEKPSILVIILSLTHSSILSCTLLLNFWVVHYIFLPQPIKFKSDILHCFKWLFLMGNTAHQRKHLVRKQLWNIWVSKHY